MKIKELHIQNFRGFEDLKIQFPDTNLAVFIGENGSGKSSVLDLLGFFLSNLIRDFFHFEKITLDIATKEGMNEADFSLWNEFASIIGQFELAEEIEFSLKDVNLKHQYFWSNLMVEWNQSLEFNYTITKKFDGYSTNWVNKYSYKNQLDLGKKIENNPKISLPIFVYYGSFFKPTSKNEIHNPFFINQLEAYKKILKPDLEDYIVFFEWFKEEENKENEIRLNNDENYKEESLEVIRNSIKLFFSNFFKANFSDLRVRRTYGFDNNYGSIKLPALFIKKNDTDFQIDMLSSGEKRLIILVTDIARRLAIANPSLQGADALNGEGIVLIDEIELHLHPSWQREVIPALRKTFPNIQFIVTTHSPQVLSGIKKVDEDSIFILKDWQVYKPSSSPIGRDSNGILEEIMGVTKRPIEVENLINEYFKAINQDDIDKVDYIKNQLANELSFDDPFFVQAEATLKRKMLLGR